MACLACLGALPVAAKSSDLQTRRRAIQQQRAEKAAQINVLKASDAQIRTALDRLDANVRAQQAQAARARQAADGAARAAAQALQAEQRTTVRLGGLQGLMRQTAVDAYVRGPFKETILPVETGSLADLSTRQFFLDVALGQDTDVADQLRAAREDLAAERVQADQARDQAAARRNEVEGQLRQVRQAEALQQRVADSAEQRLEQALAEADSLASVDAALAAEIARNQAALAARIAASHGRGSGGTLPALGSVTVTTVRGIVVATQIAQRVDELLAAAEADGFSLSGSGYRSSDVQVAVRRSHCGGSDYDVYQKPASQCSPPTARPGQSMHERGLAIDFTWNGALITSHNAAFQWLSHNAGRFGLANLPSEPWHWSTNGN